MGEWLIWFVEVTEFMQKVDRIYEKNKFNFNFCNNFKHKARLRIKSAWKIKEVLSRNKSYQLTYKRKQPNIKKSRYLLIFKLILGKLKISEFTED